MVVTRNILESMWNSGHRASVALLRHPEYAKIFADFVNQNSNFAAHPHKFIKGFTINLLQSVIQQGITTQGFKQKLNDSVKVVNQVYAKEQGGIGIMLNQIVNLINSFNSSNQQFSNGFNKLQKVSLQTKNSTLKPRLVV